MSADKFHLPRLAGPVLALLGALGAHAPAWSEPVVAHVFTHAYASVPGNTVVACYNSGMCGGTGIGPAVVNGPLPNGVGTAQSGGNADGSSTAQGSGAKVQGAGGSDPQVFLAESHASANMADGTLHAATSNNGISTYFAEDATGTAMARMKDTLTFTRLGAAGPSHIGVTFSIDGMIATAGTNFWADAETYLHLGGYAARAQFGARPPSFRADALSELFDTHAGPGDWGTWTWKQNADSSWDGLFTGDIVMTTDTLELALDMSLDMTCSHGASCDFGNTARTGLILPSEVRMTSASGQFLTASDPGTGNPVPEPASMLLVLVALGSIRAVGIQRGADSKRRQPHRQPLACS